MLRDHRLGEVLLLGVLGACATGRTPRTSPSCEPSHAAAPPAALALDAMPFVPPVFVENGGQWPAPVRFAMGGRDLRTWLERDAVVVQGVAGAGRSEVFRLRFLGAAPSQEPVPEALQPGLHSFFLGADPANWAAGLRGYGAVRYRDLCPGVDLVVAAGPVPEYTLEFAPGTSPAALAMRCEGASSLCLRADGALVCQGQLGELVQELPRAFLRGTDGGTRAVPVAFELLGGDRFALAVTAPGPGERLLVDPALRWATYVGGSAYEWAYAVTHENDGTVIVAGETTSSDFPTTAGVVDPSYNGSGPPTSDVFVARIAADGRSAVYATYLGGSSGEKPFGLASDGQGNAIVSGTTQSGNFPTTPGAFARTLNGFSDGFVASLNATGTTLLWSTYLGGDAGDEADAVAIDGSGGAWVTGVSGSSSFPTTPGAAQSVRSGSSDAIVVHIAPGGGSLLAATLLGGNDGDVGKAIARAPDGGVYVGGVTSSGDFPTTAGAAQRGLLGSSDAFLVHLSANLDNVLAGTLFGGSSGDVGEAVAVGPDGLPLLAGVTSSTDFPTTPGAFQSTARGSSDAFVAGFRANGALRFCTIIGGGGGDVGNGLAVDPSGTILLGGQCSSSDFPTTPGAVLATGSGSADAFVAHLAADCSGLLYGTLLGGAGSDGGESLAASSADAVAITGVTNSRDLPVATGAWSTIQRGTNDAFAAVLDARPVGVVRYGSPTPACLGPIRAAVTRWPAAGAADFAFTCVQAPPLALGFLVLGFAPAPGVPILGITAWLDPSQPLLSAATFADDLGFARVRLSLAGVAAGTHFFVQFVWFDPPGCGTAGGLSASDALDVTVQ